MLVRLGSLVWYWRGPLTRLDALRRLLEKD